MDICLICTKFIETETISVHEYLYDIKIKNILLDLNYKFAIQEHDQLCMDCCSNLINLYNFREVLCQFFDFEPRINVIGCVICSQHHEYMKTLSHYTPINGKHFKLLNILTEFCVYDVRIIEETSKICDNCCECLNNCYAFHLTCQEALKLWITYDLAPDLPIKLENLDDFIGKSLESNTKSTTIEPTDQPDTDDPFKCEQCSKTFKFQSRLKQHQLRHNKERVFQCPTCPKSFVDNSDLKCHERSHTDERPYPCTVCTKSFRRSHHLKDHMKTHTGEKPFKCETCLKAFAYSGDFRKHVLIHSGEKPFSCEICDKTYKRPCDLKVHLRMHSGEKPYSCEICSKSYPTKSILKTHMLAHERAFKCEYCLKSFGYKSHLRNHIRTHTGERPYKCPECDKGFIILTDFKIHMIRHNVKRGGTKPHQCQICFKSFIRKQNLKQHLLNIHST